MDSRGSRSQVQDDSYGFLHLAGRSSKRGFSFTMVTSADHELSAPGLRHALKLRHLILYGIIIIQPTAPMSIYGVVSNAARGHVATTILIAMVAMLLTAVSFGRMARVYPSAGSAYTYVGSEIHPFVGYVVGWSMLMDYMLNPIICAIWCSAAAQNVLPQVPYAAWVVAFVLLFTGLICAEYKLRDASTVAGSLHEPRGSHLSRLRGPLHRRGGATCGMHLHLAQSQY